MIMLRSAGRFVPHPCHNEGGKGSNRVVLRFARTAADQDFLAFWQVTFNVRTDFPS